VRVRSGAPLRVSHFFIGLRVRLFFPIFRPGAPGAGGALGGAGLGRSGAGSGAAGRWGRWGALGRSLSPPWTPAPQTSKSASVLPAGPCSLRPSTCVSASARQSRAQAPQILSFSQVSRCVCQSAPVRALVVPVCCERGLYSKNSFSHDGTTARPLLGGTDTRTTEDDIQHEELRRVRPHAFRCRHHAYAVAPATA